MKMTREEVRFRRKILREENAKYEPWVFVQMPREVWPKGTHAMVVNILRSKEFLVQVFAADGAPTRLTICRTAIDESGDYVDSITWDELFRIKNLCGYADRDCVEAYPVEKDLVNVANMRHLWVLPPELTEFFWRMRS